MRNDMNEIANLLMDQTNKLKDTVCAKLAPEVDADKSEHADVRLARLNKFRRTEIVILAIDPEDSELSLAFKRDGSHVMRAVAEAVGAMLDRKQAEYEESIKGVVLS